MPGGLYDAWIRAVVSSEEIAAQPDPLAEWIDTYDAQTGEHRRGGARWPQVKNHARHSQV